MTIATSHASKGLEWKAVFVSNCDDQNYPFRKGTVSVTSMRSAGCYRWPFPELRIICERISVDFCSLSMLVTLFEVAPTERKWIWFTWISTMAVSILFCNGVSGSGRHVSFFLYRRLP